MLGWKVLILGIPKCIIQGVQEKVKKSNHLVWYKNKVEFLFLAHQLRGNMSPFCLITLIKPLCLLFQSKISMQKNLRNAEKHHFWPILMNWLFQKDYWGLFYTPWTQNNDCPNKVSQLIHSRGLWGDKKSLSWPFDKDNLLK